MISLIQIIMASCEFYKTNLIKLYGKNMNIEMIDLIEGILSFAPENTLSESELDNILSTILGDDVKEILLAICTDQIFSSKLRFHYNTSDGGVISLKNEDK